MAAVAHQAVIVDDVDLIEVATKEQYLANTGLYFAAVVVEALEAAGMVQSLTVAPHCAPVTTVAPVVGVCTPVVAAVAEFVVSSCNQQLHLHSVLEPHHQLIVLPDNHLLHLVVAHY